MSGKKKSTEEARAEDSGDAEAEAPEQEERQEADDTPRWKKILREVLFLGMLVLIILSARWSLADHYHVPSGSMMPTVEIGDRIFVNKLSYNLRLPFTSVSLVDFDPPTRGDIIVLDSPVEDVVLLKRVVAIPGDTVEVRAGRIWLNGEPAEIEGEGQRLSERLGERVHPVLLTNGGGPDFGPQTLGETEYLVMGDNRGNSRDGRTFGLIQSDAILGQAVRVYYRSNDGFSWHEL